ncbi:MAG: HIT domain-containing protein [Candidatus Cloacimonas sp.]|nr:HIT domain-containing protein [Candidatus Cloacimonadota bacterium]
MFNILYSPWRFSYIEGEKEPGCIFCIEPEKDEERLVVWRSEFSFVIMNLYPYNNGHIMVVPNKHVASLDDLEEKELVDLFQTVKISEKIIRKRYKCDGLNIGMNLGKAAGAGVEEHLHVHIVPRWFGDSNFFTTTANTRVIPEDFNHSYQTLKTFYQEYEKENA